MEANYFAVLWWFSPYIDMSQPWVYMCSPSWHSLPPLSLSYPSGSSQCTSPEHPVTCIKPGLAIYFTYGIINMFQCYSLKSSQRCLLPQSLKVCSLYLCLFCCLAYRIIVTIFLNAICMHSDPIRWDQSLSRVRLFTTPWTAAYQAPPSMGFSRQEYWSGMPLPSLSPTESERLFYTSVSLLLSRR